MLLLWVESRCPAQAYSIIKPYNDAFVLSNHLCCIMLLTSILAISAWSRSRSCCSSLLHHHLFPSDLSNSPSRFLYLHFDFILCEPQEQGRFRVWMALVRDGLGELGFPSAHAPDAPPEPSEGLRVYNNLKVYNTLSREKVPFITKDGSKKGEGSWSGTIHCAQDASSIVVKFFFWSAQDALSIVVQCLFWSILLIVDTGGQWAGIFAGRLFTIHRT